MAFRLYLNWKDFQLQKKKKKGKEKEKRKEISPHGKNAVTTNLQGFKQRSLVSSYENI